MPQFAVYRNPGRNERIPFLVQVQSSRLDWSLGRVVMPLIRSGPGTPPDHALTPHLSVQGQAVLADPLNVVTVPVRRLGDALEVLSERDQDRVMRALDEMASRA